MRRCRRKQNKKQSNIKNEVMKNDVQTTTNKDSSIDKQQRRVTRTGAILAIIAVFGTICIFILKLCMNAIKLWEVQGITYRCLQGMIFLTFSAVIILFVRLVIFVVYDLMRYNVLEENYEEYDKQSDENYEKLLVDFRFYTTLLCMIFFMVLMFLSLYLSRDLKIYSITLAFSVIFFLVCAIWYGIKEYGKNLLSQICKVICKMIGKVRKRDVYKVGIWLFVAAISCFCAFSILIKNNGVVEVEFGSKGNVKICNASATTLHNMDIFVYDDNEKILFNKHIERENMLSEIERVDVYKEDSSGITDVKGIATELQHWKYQFDINDIVKEEGNYHIYLQIKVDEKIVKINNNFIKEVDGYTYAVDNVKKKY